MCESLIAGGVEFRQGRQERHHRPHLVVPTRSGPRWHAREFNAVPHDVEQFRGRELLAHTPEQWGRGCGVEHPRRPWYSGSTVTRTATGFVVSSPELYQALVVEGGDVDTE